MLLVRQQALDKAKKQDLFKFQTWGDGLMSGTLLSQKKETVGSFPVLLYEVLSK